MVGQQMLVDDVGQVAFEAAAGLLWVLAWASLRR
jgi:hypothetical protein